MEYSVRQEYDTMEQDDHRASPEGVFDIYSTQLSTILNNWTPSNFAKIFRSLLLVTHNKPLSQNERIPGAMAIRDQVESIRLKSTPTIS